MILKILCLIFFLFISCFILEFRNRNEIIIKFKDELDFIIDEIHSEIIKSPNKSNLKIKDILSRLINLKKTIK